MNLLDGKTGEKISKRIAVCETPMSGRRSSYIQSYINRAKKKERESSISSRRSLDRKTDCFFCRTNVDLQGQKRRKGDVFRVKTLETKHTVLQTCFQ